MRPLYVYLRRFFSSRVFHETVCFSTKWLHIKNCFVFYCNTLLHIYIQMTTKKGSVGFRGNATSELEHPRQGLRQRKTKV